MAAEVCSLAVVSVLDASDLLVMFSEVDASVALLTVSFHLRNVHPEGSSATFVRSSSGSLCSALQRDELTNFQEFVADVKAFVSLKKYAYEGRRTALSI